MSKDADITKIAGEKLNSPSRNRDWFLTFWVDLTLDADTAYPKIKVTNDNKTAEMTSHDQTGDKNPKRFLYEPEVLCNEGLTGKKYWEIDWVGTLGVGISVSYKIIPRDIKGDESRFGRNTYSWSLEDCVQRELMHGKDTSPVHSHYNRVGVFIDTEAGILQYYSVTPDLDHMTLLYQAPQSEKKFTEALYPGFWICDDSKMFLCAKHQPTPA